MPEERDIRHLLLDDNILGKGEEYKMTLRRFREEYPFIRNFRPPPNCKVKPCRQTVEKARTIVKAVVGMTFAARKELHALSPKTLSLDNIVISYDNDEPRFKEVLGIPLAELDDDYCEDYEHLASFIEQRIFAGYYEFHSLPGDVEDLLDLFRHPTGENLQLASRHYACFTDEQRLFFHLWCSERAKSYYTQDDMRNLRRACPNLDPTERWRKMVQQSPRSPIGKIYKRGLKDRAYILDCTDLIYYVRNACEHMLIHIHGYETIKYQKCHIPAILWCYFPDIIPKIQRELHRCDLLPMEELKKLPY